MRCSGGWILGFSLQLLLCSHAGPESLGGSICGSTGRIRRLLFEAGRFVGFGFVQDWLVCVLGVELFYVGVCCLSATEDGVESI